jgi:putative transposase
LFLINASQWLYNHVTIAVNRRNYQGGDNAMLVLEYKAVVSQKQKLAINEAIRTTQFIRNKAIRYWMDAPKKAKLNRIALNNYSTALRKEFKFVAELNSMACQSATERAWIAIERFYSNCKSQKPGKKGFPRFQKDNRERGI